MTLIVCETDDAIAYHIRRGNWQPCGHQDTQTLCDRRAAWDTKIALAAVLVERERGAEDKVRCCAECREKGRALLLEDT